MSVSRFLRSSLAVLVVGLSLSVAAAAYAADATDNATPAQPAGAAVEAPPAQPAADATAVAPAQPAEAAQATQADAPQAELTQPASATETTAAPAAAPNEGQAAAAPAVADPAPATAAPIAPVPSAIPPVASTEPAAAKPAGKPAPDQAVQPAAPAEPEHENVSTVELLNEDAGIENAHTGEEPQTQGLGTAEEPTEGSEAGAAPETEHLVATDESADPFPTSPGIEQQKEFWIRIFTHYDSNQGVLHDGRIALPVYEDLELNGMKYREQRRYVLERKRDLMERLRALGEAVEAGTTLDDAQQALLARLPVGSTVEEIRDFADNVRFQRGLADRFRDGLIASGALMEHMKEILARHKVPQDLMYLPHVESSFNNNTHSHAGAVGIWQFTRGTARLFMTVGYEVDQRFDPIVATESAARYLRQNYERLGTWPLAITAYNHGPQSLERISRNLGTRDLGVLIEQFEGRLFGFASKNFYAEFLAARQVAQDYEQYFGPLELAPTLRYRTVELPWYVDPAVAAETLNVDFHTLRKLNPALRDLVWSGSKYIPAGYSLRIPPDKDPKALLAAIPEAERHDKQKRSLYVRVQRGDTLYSIGRRHGIPWQTIASANNIASTRRLLPGQRLILPWDGTTPPQALVAKDGEVKEEPAGQTLDSERIVERIAVQAAAPWTGGVPEDNAATPAADRFQELRVLNKDSSRKIGEIVAAYGETVGAYSRWCGVTPIEVRRLNDMSGRSVLRPGQPYLVPLDAVTAEKFEEQRLAFHREREQSFFAEYDIKEKVKIAVRRGHSPWILAQANNVPMWLFYRENPELLTQPLRVGMEVILPVLTPNPR